MPLTTSSAAAWVVLLPGTSAAGSAESMRDPPCPPPTIASGMSASCAGWCGAALYPPVLPGAAKGPHRAMHARTAIAAKLAPAAVRIFLRAGCEAATAVEDTRRLPLGARDLGFGFGRGAAAGRAGLMASIGILEVAREAPAAAGEAGSTARGGPLTGGGTAAAGPAWGACPPVFRAFSAASCCRSAALSADRRATMPASWAFCTRSSPHRRSASSACCFLRCLDIDAESLLRCMRATR
mmetsp:Transcript_2414/g.7237  ORF Transcript_2414/g.7237 Transcript_2414/m.7237 type:complete len:239 (+) Transcript_2414:2882-3598(+)